MAVHKIVGAKRSPLKQLTLCQNLGKIGPELSEISRSKGSVWDRAGCYSVVGSHLGATDPLYKAVSTDLSRLVKKQPELKAAAGKTRDTLIKEHSVTIVTTKNTGERHDRAWRNWAHRPLEQGSTGTI